jgi:hypothetical protein
MNSCRVVAELGGADCDDDEQHHHRRRHLYTIKALAFNILTSYTSATSRSAVMGGKTCSCCSASQQLCCNSQLWSQMRRLPRPPPQS